jgi:hypothetical protein
MSENKRKTLFCQDEDCLLRIVIVCNLMPAGSFLPSSFPAILLFIYGRDFLLKSVCGIHLSSFSLSLFF